MKNSYRAVIDLFSTEAPEMPYSFTNLNEQLEVILQPLPSFAGFNFSFKNKFEAGQIKHVWLSVTVTFGSDNSMIIISGAANEAELLQEVQEQVYKYFAGLGNFSL